MRLKIEVFVALCLLALAAQYAIRLGHAERERNQAAQVRDSLWIEDAANRAAIDGWAVQFGVLEKDLNGKISRRDSLNQRLAASLDRANAKVRTLTDLVVTLNDSLTSVGTAGDTTEAGDVTYTGEIDDGLLRATWGFVPPALSLAYGVTVPLEIVTSEGGDGRWLVVARSKDSRASVSVKGFWFSPPAPVRVAKCTLTQTAWRFGLGVLAGSFVPR